MRVHPGRTWAHRACVVAQFAAGSLSIYAGAALKADIGWFSGWWPLAASFFSVGQKTAPLLVVVSPILIAAFGWLKTAIGSPSIWKTVHEILDQMQKRAFEDCDGPPHHHRVTLFKVTRCRVTSTNLPWARWLVPVERSGHATRQSKSAFRIPDAADHAEGIAGRTWAMRNVVTVDNLPELSASSRPEQIQDYAQKTYVSPDWLRESVRRSRDRRRPLARAFCGIPVEVKGELWGVLVFDSCRKDLSVEKALAEFQTLGRFLGKLLERA